MISLPTGYSSSGRGYIFVPEDELAVPYLAAEEVEPIRSALLTAESDTDVVAEYEQSVLGVSKGESKIGQLALAKRIFFKTAEDAPEQRIPFTVVLNANDVAHALILSLDHRIAMQRTMNIEFYTGGRSTIMPIDRSCTLGLGLRPLAGREMPLTYDKGVINPLLPTSGWYRDVLVDYVGYDDQNPMAPPRRLSSVIAMGDMVEPLLHSNGLQDLYTAWEQVNNPGVRSQIMGIIQSNLKKP